MSDREISEHHEAILRNASNSPSGTIPDKVVEIYWDMSRTLRRLGHNMSDRDIALVCVLAGLPAVEPATTFLNAIEEYGIVFGDKIAVKFRKRWRIAEFKQLKDGKVVAQILDDDNAEEREFHVTAARSLTLEERQKLSS